VRKLDVCANTSAGNLLSSILLSLGFIFPEIYIRKLSAMIPKRAGAWSKLQRPKIKIKRCQEISM